MSSKTVQKVYVLLGASFVIEENCIPIQNKMPTGKRRLPQDTHIENHYGNVAKLYQWPEEMTGRKSTHEF